MTIAPVDQVERPKAEVVMPLRRKSMPTFLQPPMPDRRLSPQQISEATDSELVAAVARKDQTALEEIYKRNSAAVFGLCSRLLGDRGAAEDIAQEIFVRLWNEPQRFDAERGSLRTYLQKQAHSRSIEKIRSESARQRREDSYGRQYDSEKLETEVLASIQLVDIKHALLQLDEQEREAIVLAYYGGLSYREVATRLLVPEGTIKSRIRIGLRKLAEFLNPDGTEVRK